VLRDTNSRSHTLLEDLRRGRQATTFIAQRLLKIWKQHHFWKENKELAELGRNVAVFLSSAIYISEWIGEKTVHKLFQPTPDAVRLALASVLLAADMSKRLELLD